MLPLFHKKSTPTQVPLTGPTLLTDPHLSQQHAGLQNTELLHPQQEVMQIEDITSETSIV